MGFGKQVGFQELKLLRRFFEKVFLCVFAKKLICLFIGVFQKPVFKYMGGASMYSNMQASKYKDKKEGYQRQGYRQNYGSQEKSYGGKYSQRGEAQSRGYGQRPAQKQEQRGGQFQRDNQAPTEKQLKFAHSLAEKYGVEIPEEALQSRKDLSKWIDSQMQSIPPTEKQTAFMERLAEERGIEPPEEAYLSKARCSEWITSVLEESRAKSKSSKSRRFTQQREPEEMNEYSEDGFEEDDLDSPDIPF